jgi:hypothetical protein
MVRPSARDLSYVTVNMADGAKMITPSAQSSLQARPVIENGDPRQAPAQRKAFTVAEIAFRIGAPLAWAVLLLFLVVRARTVPRMAPAAAVQPTAS